MIRARFYTSAEDYRPVVWPIKHPYWCTGYSGDGEKATIVAYADSVEQLLEWWPDAARVNVLDEGLDTYEFSERFPRPDWFATVWLKQFKTGMDERKQSEKGGVE